VVDGEVTALDAQGHPRVQSASELSIRLTYIMFFIFDILFYIRH
jgi:hypothetical protein